jgi:phospholipid-transporting ATPase
MSCFNVIFTFLPPMAIGIFDQFASARLLDKYPQVYALGQTNEFFNQKRFWGWILNAVYHSAVSSESYTLLKILTFVYPSLY